MQDERKIFIQGRYWLYSVKWFVLLILIGSMLHVWFLSAFLHVIQGLSFVSGCKNPPRFLQRYLGGSVDSPCSISVFHFDKNQLGFLLLNENFVSGCENLLRLLPRYLGQSVDSPCSLSVSNSYKLQESTCILAKINGQICGFSSIQLECFPFLGESTWILAT